jgi:hypothetical protein
MAQTTNDGLFNLPYPEQTDPVNIVADIKALADRLKIVLPPLGISAFQIPVKNTTGHSIAAATPVYASGYLGKTLISKCIPTTENPILGLTKTVIADGSDGIVIVAGVLDGVNTSSFETGDILYVSDSSGLTNTQPSTGSGAVGIVAYAATEGIIIVEAKGNGTWGALKAGLA